MRCASCGQENRELATFCDSCGSRLISEVIEVIDESAPFTRDEPDDGFVGRQQELGELTQALQDARSGQGRLVMLVGEPGIGKTTVARKLAAQAQAEGMQMLWGRCYEGEGAPPYWPWVQLVESYLQQSDVPQLQVALGSGAADVAEIVPELHQLLPDLPPVPTAEPEQAQFRLFSAITNFLRNAARANPILIVLDDLHWADGSSLRLLEFLTRRLEDAQLLMVGTYRDVEVARRHPLYQSLGNLIREPVFKRIQLHGLTLPEVGLLALITSGTEPAPNLTQQIHSRTEGNPLFITEVVRSISEEQSNGNSSPPAALPEGVKEAISRRLDRSSEDCNQFLTLASVVGREFDVWLLKELLPDTSEDRLLAVVEEALQLRLIEETTDSVSRYRFSHGLIQETLLEEITTLRRTRMHARIAEKLEELYGPNVHLHAAELAHHYAEAEGPDRDAKLARYSLLAGQQALEAYDAAGAALHFERGLSARAGQPMDQEMAQLYFGMGRAQRRTLEIHRMTEAAANLQQAFDYFMAMEDVEQAVAVAEIRLSPFPGVRSGMASIVRRALEIVPEDSHLAGRLYRTYGRLQGMEEGDYPAAREAFDRALAIARRVGDIALECETLSDSAQAEMHQLHWVESLERGRRALHLSGGVDIFAERAAREWMSFVLMTTDDVQAIRENASRMIEIYNLTGSVGPGACFATDCIEQSVGNWEKAREFNMLGVSLGPRDPRLLGNRVLLETQVGNFEEAAQFSDRLIQTRDLTRPGATLSYVYNALTLSIAASISGDASYLNSARDAGATVLASDFATPDLSIRARTGLALIAIMEGDVEECRQQYTVLEPFKRTMLRHNFAADRLLGLLARTIGNLEQAIDHFEESLDFCRNAGYLPEVAWTCYDYADTLLEQDRKAYWEQARSLLEESLAIATDLGMPPLTERVQAHLEGLGTSPPAYPNGLTQREVEVLTLIAHGKNNREIGEALVITEATARRHVSNIYDKIGVTNRTEATRYALAHNLASLDN